MPCTSSRVFQIADAYIWCYLNVPFYSEMIFNKLRFELHAKQNYRPTATTWIKNKIRQVAM
jgi:hypothetical protein